MVQASEPGAAERIDRELTAEILRGDLAPGSRLAPVRELARRFGVNPSTVQRAIARLEAKRLVVARQGSGLTVQDPVEVGDLSLLPDWLVACADDPARSATLLDELLEVRRMLATRLLVTHRDTALGALGHVASAASSLPDGSPEEVRAIDLAVARTVVRATGSVAAHAVLGSFERALDQLPELVTATYGDQAPITRSLLEVLAALEEGGGDLAERIEAAFEAVDRRTVTRYAELLAGRPTARPLPPDVPAPDSVPAPRPAP